MGSVAECPDEVAVLTERIILPEMTPMPAKYWRDLLRSTEPVDYLKPGVYDAYGQWVCGLHDEDKEKRGRVFIEFAGVTFVWGVFSRELKPGERGDMFFTGAPGTGPITSFFTEWDPATGLPRISKGRGYLSLIASMRGRNTARVAGENHYGKALYAAAGFIVSQNVDMPPKQ